MTLHEIDAINAVKRALYGLAAALAQAGRIEDAAEAAALTDYAASELHRLANSLGSIAQSTTREHASTPAENDKKT